MGLSKPQRKVSQIALSEEERNRLELEGRRRLCDCRPFRETAFAGEVTIPGYQAYPRTWASRLLCAGAGGSGRGTSPLQSHPINKPFGP